MLTVRKSKPRRDACEPDPEIVEKGYAGILLGNVGPDVKQQELKVAPSRLVQAH